MACTIVQKQVNKSVLPYPNKHCKLKYGQKNMQGNYALWNIALKQTLWINQHIINKAHYKLQIKKCNKGVNQQSILSFNSHFNFSWRHLLVSVRNES